MFNYNKDPKSVSQRHGIESYWLSSEGSRKHRLLQRTSNLRFRASGGGSEIHRIRLHVPKWTTPPARLGTVGAAQEPRSPAESLALGVSLPQLFRQVEPFEFELSGVQLDSRGGPAQRELRFIEPVPADDRFRVDSLKAGRRPTQRSGYQRGGQRRATIDRSGLPCSNSRALISWISIRC